ncbi:MAG TPA: hypothetical protein VH704_14795 [Casimicrobiaceae bacterium]|jgi:hypothetical protein|nr:hypothetical protein [Casimicrobiaceae bacterium]
MAAHGAGSEGSGDGVLFPPASVVYPGTREFQWTIRVPLLTIDQREFVFKAPTGITRTSRWGFEGPAVRTEHRKIGTYPEFSCKYIDWTVSNECRTVWRGVYADLPVIVTRPQHLDFDIPDWRWKTQLVPIGVVRWTWKEERWIVSVPVIVADPDDSRAYAADRPMAGADFERARMALAAKEAAALAVLDDGLRALDRSIATAEAYGADPRRIESDDGGALDLIATRVALRDARADVEQRFRRIGGELEAAANTTRPSGG